MSGITIPPEALEAALKAYWQEHLDTREAIEAACLAMLRAWTGVYSWTPENQHDNVPAIILPLPEKPAHE